MPRILFVFPPAPRKYHFDYHLGAGYIRAFLEKHHIETAQFTTTHEKTIPTLTNDILACNPDVVGFTCYDANYPYVRILCTSLKKRNPSLPIIVGGPAATFSTEMIMRHTPQIDVCIRGEGEHTVHELLEKGLEDLEAVQGITFRSKNELVSTPLRPLISGEKGEELDCLPSPYLTGMIPPDGTTGILTARGCVYHCTYCNFSTMFNHTIRYHSVDRVVEELAMIREHFNPAVKETVSIHDDIFSLNVKRAKAICQKLIDEGINLPLFLETRADNCDQELLELMREAGIKSVNFGLESGSLTVLRAIRKCPGREEKFLSQVNQCARWARGAGMTTSVSIILGLPEEGVKEAEETLKFVEEVGVDEYFHNVLFLFAGTELFRTRKKYGIKAAHSPYFLPFTTIYTYDVERVQPLPHAVLYKQMWMWKKTYYDLSSYGAGKGKDAYSYLVIKNMPDDMERFSKFLQEKAVLHLSVVDFTSNLRRKEVNQRIRRLLRGGIPVGLYSVVREGQLTLYNPVEMNNPIVELPFRTYKRGMEALFTLDEREDVEALACFADTHTRRDILSFSTGEIPLTLAGTCRWGESVCPALSRGVLVVEGEKVLSCLQGGCIGTIDDSQEHLKENIQKMLREKEKERECHACAVEKECSHCLFPYPLTDTEFCALKRRYRISKVITLLEWLHDYGEKGEGEISLRIGEEAPPLFYEGDLTRGEGLPKVRERVYLIRYKGKASVFTADDMKSFSVEPALAATLEACQMGVDKKRLSLDKDHSLSDILFLLDGIGVLSP